VFQKFRNLETGWPIIFSYPLFPKRRIDYQMVTELSNFGGMKLENYTDLKVNY